MNLLLSLLAADATSVPTTGGPSGFERQIVPIILMAVVLWLFFFRANRNRDKARTSQLDKLKAGQRIQTIGGIMGVITQVSEKEVTVKVDETNNVKIKFARNAIHRIVEDDKEKTDTK